MENKELNNVKVEETPIEKRGFNISRLSNKKKMISSLVVIGLIGFAGFEAGVKTYENNKFANASGGKEEAPKEKSYEASQTNIDKELIENCGNAIKGNKTDLPLKDIENQNIIFNEDGANYKAVKEYTATDSAGKKDLIITLPNGEMFEIRSEVVCKKIKITPTAIPTKYKEPVYKYEEKVKIKEEHKEEKSENKGAAQVIENHVDQAATSNGQNSAAQNATAKNESNISVNGNNNDVKNEQSNTINQYSCSNVNSPEGKACVTETTTIIVEPTPKEQPTSTPVIVPTSTPPAPTPTNAPTNTPRPTEKPAPIAMPTDRL